MHIHLPLVLEAILFSWIALYWLIYKILLRKKLSPLLVSLIANSDYGFMKVFPGRQLLHTRLCCLACFIS